MNKKYFIIPCINKEEHEGRHYCADRWFKELATFNGQKIECALTISLGGLKVADFKLPSYGRVRLASVHDGSKFFKWIDNRFQITIE